LLINLVLIFFDKYSTYFTFTLKETRTSIIKCVTLKVEWTAKREREKERERERKGLMIFCQIFTYWERTFLIIRNSLIYHIYNPWRLNNSYILNSLTRYLSRFQFSGMPRMHKLDSMCSNSSCSDFHVSALQECTFHTTLR